MGLSFRETVAVLEWLDVDRSHEAVWNWTHKLSESQSDPPTAEPSRVAVDENRIEIDGEEKRLYAAIDAESKILLGVDVTSRCGIGPAAAFLESLTELHDLDDTNFLVDSMGYLTVLARHRLSGHLDYSDRNHIENCPVSSS